MLARGFGKYITKVLDQNDYDADPEVIIPYFRAIESGLVSKEIVAEGARESYAEGCSGENQFEEFYCAKLRNKTPYIS